MIDIKFLRENPDAVKENIKKKFQDDKLPMVDEVIEFDKEKREALKELENIRAGKNKASKMIGQLMAQGKKDEANEVKKQIAESGKKEAELNEKVKKLDEEVTKRMMVIPQMIDPSVPIGPDDTHNVEIERFGEPVVPDFPIPYHTDIMEAFDGVDMDAAGRVAGNGFYYLLGDIARLHSAVLTYARDFMIDRGFTYVIPPYMIRSNVVTGVMSFAEMDAMMYKIEGEDLYLIGTSEHSMIGRFIDQIIPEEKMPLTLTSYSPCFRKEKGAHGIEERGVYRIHQFEKQEMIVVCRPEDSWTWYNKLWQNTVDLFRSMDIPVRTLECCSGDLADLKVKSCDVEAWSPRQKKYFEVGSCSNLGDAQARRLKIRIQGKDGKKYLAHTLNNTCVAPPRMLIAFLENNLQADGTVKIPEVLRPYMGGKEVLVPSHPMKGLTD
ncbi:MAG: serine--tRNA ligase [Eubacterium sp.]|nr:serine--tRNA ligase [Eubacterium sp.]